MNKYLLNAIIAIVIDILLLICVFYLTLYIRSSLDSPDIPMFNQLFLKDFYFIIFIYVIYYLF